MPAIADAVGLADHAVKARYEAYRREAKRPGFIEIVVAVVISAPPFAGLLIPFFNVEPVVVCVLRCGKNHVQTVTAADGSLPQSRSEIADRAEARDVNRHSVRGDPLPAVIAGVVPFVIPLVISHLSPEGVLPVLAPDRDFLPGLSVSLHQVVRRPPEVIQLLAVNPYLFNSFIVLRRHGSHHRLIHKCAFRV